MDEAFAAYVASQLVESNADTDINDEEDEVTNFYYGIYRCISS